MSTTLCFDFGNTRRKVAVFKNADIKEVIVLQDDSNATIESLVKDCSSRLAYSGCNTWLAFCRVPVAQTM